MKYKTMPVVEANEIKKAVELQYAGNHWKKWLEGSEIMPKYRVKLTKHEIYSDIEANSYEEAEEIAIDYYQNDKMAFLDDKIDEIETERIDIEWK